MICRSSRHAQSAALLVVISSICFFSCKQRNDQGSDQASFDNKSGSHSASQDHDIYKDFEHGPWANPTCLGARDKLPTQRQSPIMIDPREFQTAAVTLMDHKGASVTVVDNGHTMQANYPEDYVQRGDGFVELDGETFYLEQFHFHAPAEHVVSGQEPYEMEMHLVHKNREKTKALALGFFITSDNGNADNNTAANGLLDLMNTYDKSATHKNASSGSHGGADAVHKLGKVWVDIAALTATARGKFFTYEGSLTTPPCAEIVTHMVAQKPVKFGRRQVRSFTRLYDHNARPLQSAGSGEIRNYRLAQ